MLVGVAHVLDGGGEAVRDGKCDLKAFRQVLFLRGGRVPVRHRKGKPERLSLNRHVRRARKEAKLGRDGGSHHTGQRLGPTGSLGASGKRREASRGARGRCGAIALGKGLEQGLHTSTTMYLALAATTSMPSMLAVVVERAEVE